MAHDGERPVETLADEEIETRRTGVVATTPATIAADTGDDPGDPSDATDTGDDTGDASDSADDAGDRSDASDAGDDAADDPTSDPGESPGLVP